MNTKQIELLLDLSRTLNYRKTAENMYISQPALTHQINSLENELGFKLFYRSSQGVELTPAGKLFCQNAEHIYNSVNRTIAAALNCSREYTDSMIVGINPQRMTKQMSEVLRRFTEKNSNIMPQIKQIIGIEKLNAFLRGELDITVFVSDIIKPSLNIHHEKLYESRLYCVVNKDSHLAGLEKISPYDLKGHRVQTSSGRSPTLISRAQDDLRSKVSFHEVRSQGYEEALLWVRAVGAAALVPGFCYIHDPSLMWVPYDWNETANFSIAWHPEDKRPFIKDYVDIMLDVFHRDAQNGTIL